MAMASSQTSNYGLCQWEATDRVVHTDFNEDNQKIDSALHSLQTAVNSKASSSSVNAALNTVTQDLEDLTAECAMVVSGSYVGNGGSGASEPCTISLTGLNRMPLLVVVREESNSANGLILLYGMKDCSCNVSGNLSNSNQVTITTWSERQVAWYGNTPGPQLNTSGRLYRYFAVG